MFFLMKYSFGIVFSGVVRIRDYGLWVMGYGFAVICRSTRGKNIFLMILFYHKCNMQSRFINMSTTTNARMNILLTKGISMKEDFSKSNVYLFMRLSCMSTLSSYQFRKYNIL